MRFLRSGFFHKSVSLGPLSIPLGPFWMFSKIRGDIHEWMFISGVNDTGKKREKFWDKILGFLVIYIGRTLYSPVSLTQPKNLSPMSLTPSNSLSPVLLTPLINIHSRLSWRIFEKSRNDPNVLLRGPGDTDSWKKLRSKISCQTPFKAHK